MPESQKPLRLQLSDFQIDTPADANSLRTFSAVVSSGQPFDHWGSKMIVDLSSVSFADKTPALHLHDRSQRVGFGTLAVVDNQLTATGSFLNNELATAIAKDADDGFPWQMSVDVHSETVDELAHGETAEVNGQSVTGPMLILRNNKISEFSFTPTGVDSNTTAMALSDDGGESKYQFTDSKDNTMPMTPEEIAAMQAENAKLKQDNEALKTENEKLKADKKASDMDAQLSQAGFKKDDAGAWQGVSNGMLNALLSATAEDATAMIADLKPTQAKADDDKQAPSFLFSETTAPSGNEGDGKHVQLSQNPQGRSSFERDYV